MGANLARVELETLFRHLLDRLEWFELAAPPERLNSAVNGGIKHLSAALPPHLGPGWRACAAVRPTRHIRGRAVPWTR